jgi:shikimate kinase
MAEVTAAKKNLRDISSSHLHINPSPHLRIFLVGMMGSGKTYWADKLKKKLKIPAYDLDNLVEIMEEQTIAEMFAEKGEEYFRKEESKMLRLFKEKKSFILSCGGGTPCFNDNMQWMNKNGITVWLNETVEVLSGRLAEEKEQRPLIKDLDDDGLKEFLQRKLEERKEYYEQAKYKLSGDQLTESGLIKLLREHA